MSIDTDVMFVYVPFRGYRRFEPQMLGALGSSVMRSLFLSPSGVIEESNWICILLLPGVSPFLSPSGVIEESNTV